MSHAAVRSIRHSEIPQYLHTSELYLSFGDEPNDELSVPANCLKEDARVSNALDLEHLLLTMRFWILRYFPAEVIEFLVNESDKDCEAVLEKYSREFPSVLELVQGIHATFYKMHHCNLACMHGRLDFVEYFVKRGHEVQMLDLQSAITNGNHDCLVYVYDHLPKASQTQDLTSICLKAAVRRGYLDCLVFMVGKGVEVSENLCAHAILHNHLEVLKFLVAQVSENNEEISLRTWKTAIKNSPSCLTFLMETFPSETAKPDLVNLACQLGNATALRILVRHGCVVNMTTVTTAAQGGSYECLQYVHDEVGINCFVPSTMAAAAGAGKLKLVRRLHEEKCPWDGTAIAAARQANQQKCCAYLYKLLEVKVFF